MNRWKRTAFSDHESGERGPYRRAPDRALDRGTLRAGDRAWAFEAEPASPKPLLNFYLDAVKPCDVFLLIVGQHVTRPVGDEVQVAVDYRKPMLVFCKEVSTRDPEAQ